MSRNKKQLTKGQIDQNDENVEESMEHINRDAQEEHKGSDLTGKEVTSLEPGDEAAKGKGKGSKGETAPEKESHGRKMIRHGKKADLVQKRVTRANRKELLELIQKKNVMLQKMEDAIEEAAQELKNKDDKIIRMVAEFENYKKRTRREWELLQKKASAELITSILGILDDFERAMEAAGETEDHFHSGIRMIFAALIDVLGSAGLKVIEAQSQPFDPQFHEAVGEIESDEIEDGHVAHVVRNGYTLYDQLLRPARVMVAKKK